MFDKRYEGSYLNVLYQVGSKLTKLRLSYLDNLKASTAFLLADYSNQLEVTSVVSTVSAVSESFGHGSNVHEVSQILNNTRRMLDNVPEVCKDLRTKIYMSSLIDYVKEINNSTLNMLMIELGNHYLRCRDLD